MTYFFILQMMNIMNDFNKEVLNIMMDKPLNVSKPWYNEKYKRDIITKDVSYYIDSINKKIKNEKVIEKEEKIIERATLFDNLDD